MSLDLANKAGRAHNTSALAAADLSAVSAATFDGGDVADAGSFLLQLDTNGGDIDLATMPTSMVLPSGEEALMDGSEVTMVKNSPDSNRLTFTDPVTGIAYNYVNRPGESLSLVLDTSTGAARWVAKI